MHPIRQAFFVSICLALLSSSGCGREGQDNLLERATGTGALKGNRVVTLPSQVLGLKVAKEQVSKDVLKVDRPYIDSVGIFSMRENDLLRATLQVSRMNAVARPKSNSFRNSIINLMGTTSPQKLLVSDTVVYNTAGNKQSLFVWFEGRGFYVLSVHEDYEFPRTLLRRMIDLEQKL